MATHVQSASDTGTNASPDVTTSSDVTSGNDLLICVSQNYGNAPTTPVAGDLAMSGTATFGTTEVAAAVAHDAGEAHQDAAVYRVPVTGSGTCTATYSNGTTPNKGYISITEVSGLSSASAEASQTVTDAASDTAPALASMSSAGDGIFIGVIGVVNSSVPAITKGTDFTEIGNLTIGGAGADFGGESQYQTVTGATADVVEWTVDANQGHAAAGAVFADDAAGGTSTPQGLHGINHGVNPQRSTRLGGELEE